MLVYLVRPTSYSVCYTPSLHWVSGDETLEDIQEGIEEYIAAKVNTEQEPELEPEIAAESKSKPAIVNEPNQSQR